MKILLAGASGFIGKNFLEYAADNLEIIAIYNKSRDIVEFIKNKKLKNVKLYRCDFTNKEEVKNLLEKIGNGIDYCIYLCGNANVPLSITDPTEDLYSNTLAIINFLQHCNIKKFIYLSSAAVYDGNKGKVATNTKLNPVIPYCISKLACEHYIRFYASKGKIKEFIILRFGGAYGKYSPKKFLSKVVDEICIKNKKTIEVYGDGTNIINVMYVKDAIRGLLACLHSNKSNVICNMGQDNMTIAETIQRIANIFNKEIEIKYTPRISNQKYIGFKIDVDFNKIFGFKPDYSFESGIKEFAELMKNEKL